MPEPFHRRLVAPGGRLKPWQAALFAISATAATFGLRVALDGPLGGQQALIIFTLPIMLSAYVGGLLAGLLATALSFFGASYYLLPPIHSFAIASSVDRWQQAFLALVGISLSALGESLHRARGYAAHVERRQSEIASHLAAIVTSSDDAIVGQDLQGIVTSWNDGAERLFGYSAREMIGSSISRLIPPARPDEEAHVLETVRRGVALKHFETVRQTRDGRRIDISLTTCPIRDGAGRILGASIIARDIAELKRAEGERNTLDRQRRLALDAARLGWWHFNPVTRLNKHDDRSREIFGVEGQETTEERMRNLVDPADVPGVWAAVEAALDPVDPKPYAVEFRISQRDGSVRWIEVHGLAEFVGEGDARHAVSLAGTVANVTERKLAEAALRNSEERFRAVADQSIQGLILVQEGSATYVNPAHCEITGYSEEEALAQTAEQRFAMIHADNTARVLDRKRRDDRGEPIEEVSEIRITRKDGQLRWVLSSNRAFTLQGKPARLGILLDITERKRAEAALRESEGKLRNVIDGLGPYIFAGLMTPDGVLIEANQPALDAAGLTLEDVLGKPFAEAYWWAYSEAVQEQLIAAITRAAAGASSRYDVQVRVAEATFLWIDFSLFPVHDARGDVIFLVPSGNVIEERKHAESALRELTHRLLHAEDEERRRIAKELHDSTAQDLVAVLLNLGTLRDSLPELGAAPAQVIDDSIALLENSANDIRTLSYALHPPRLDEMGLPGALAEYAAGLGKRAGVRIHVEAEPDFGRLREDQEHALFRVAQESLSNVVRHSESDSATIRLASQGGSIVVTIEDHGRGLPPDLGTRRGAHGVGILGMRERLQNLGGRLEIVSGKSGTTVRAVLPSERRRERRC